VGIVAVVIVAGRTFSNRFHEISRVKEHTAFHECTLVTHSIEKKNELLLLLLSLIKRDFFLPALFDWMRILAVIVCTIWPMNTTRLPSRIMGL
jgi:hypothetical protein